METEVFPAQGGEVDGEGSCGGWALGKGEGEEGIVCLLGGGCGMR